MQIILVSDRMATAKTITVSARHAVLGVIGFVLAVMFVSSVFSFVTLRTAAHLKLPFVQEVVLGVHAREAAHTQAFLRENIDAMALKLGELQAQLMRMDVLGERLAGFVGIKPQEIKAGETPGRGGPLIEPTRPLTADELNAELVRLSSRVENHGEVLDVIESQLLEERIRAYMKPTTLPVAGAWDASGFGWRVDPFNGHRAMHAGVDFSGDVGTPIVAAAGGVVTNVERHAQYGWMVDIDHGNELSTRYAHCSKIDVKPGAIVKPGQKIAEVGSTGRSTGAHLHFEVRINGVPQNPNRFLVRARDGHALARK